MLTREIPNVSSVHMSDSGYMTSELFSGFLYHISRHKLHRKFLLILDRYASHCKNPDVLEKASELGV
jgi:hypothetical protein